MKFLSWLKGLFKKGIRTSEADEKRVVSLAKSGEKIKFGTALDVKPNFVAVLCYHNKVADVFEEGHYRLDTNNMPLLTRIEKLTRKNRRGDLPKFFRADIYFVNKKEFENEKFFASDPVVIKNKDYRNFEARLCGTFSYHVKNPVDFLETLFTQYGLVDDIIARKEIESWVAELSTKCVQRKKLNPQMLFDRDSSCFEGLYDFVEDKLYDCGVSLLKIEIDDVKFPKRVYKNTKFFHKEKNQEDDVNEIENQNSQEDDGIGGKTLIEEADAVAKLESSDVVEHTEEIEYDNGFEETENENELMHNSNDIVENQFDATLSENQNQSYFKNEEEIQSIQNQSGQSKFEDAEVKPDASIVGEIRYKVCPVCSAQCSEDSVFCFKCGHKFID